MLQRPATATAAPDEVPSPLPALTVPPEQLRRIEVGRMSLVERANSLSVLRTPQDLEEAGKVLVEGVRALQRQIEESYERIMAPQRAALAATRAEMAEQLRPVLAAKATLDGAIRDYRRREEAAREALARKELTRYDEAESRGEVVELPAAPPPVAKAAGVSVREHWTSEVVDAAALKREFLMPDESRIRRLVTALKQGAVEAVSVAGKRAIRVWRDDIVASSRRGGA
jgi:hypothetical protein